MTFTDAVKTCFRKYITFSGRASRAEFWKFVLFLVLTSILLLIINTLICGPDITAYYRLDANGQPVGDPVHIKASYNTGWFGNIFFLGTALPWLAVGWRRLHDSNRPGYLPWLSVLGWIALVVFVVGMNLGFAEMFRALKETGQAHVASVGGGVFTLFAFLAVFLLNLFWLTQPSDPHTNRFGPNPQEVPQ